MCHPPLYTAGEGDLFASSSGSVLCQTLIRTYDVVLVRPLDQCHTAKLACIGALKALLSLSMAAKMAALEGQ